MREKIAAGNWKMNLTLEEGLELSRSIANAERPDNVHTILAVPFTHLKTIRDQTMHVPGISIAAQNCHYELSGAFTGEISPAMLKHLSIPYVLLGHSERREYFNETNNLLTKKIKAAIACGLKVIFCCGESLDIREKGNHIDFVKNQLKESLESLTMHEMEKLCIAYEPIWAIGTGKTASSIQAQEMHKEIRNFLQELFGTVLADHCPILYGGSVKPDNAQELFSMKDIDGGLVGGASLDTDSFLQIIHAF
jgi:triosephosphate isomerase